MKKSAPYLVLAGCAILLMACNPFSALDNPSDPNNILTEKWRVIQSEDLGDATKYVIASEVITAQGTTRTENWGSYYIEVKDHGTYLWLGETNNENKTYFGAGDLWAYRDVIQIKEIYDVFNWCPPLLRKPPVVADSWSGGLYPFFGHTWNALSTVKSTSDTVTIGSTMYADCLAIQCKVTGDGAGSDPGNIASPEENGFGRGMRTIWFDEGVGIVKIEWAHESGDIDLVELQSCSVSLSSDYFPLAINNQWTYSWRYIPASYND